SMYSDFTNLSTTLIAGESYTLSLTTSSDNVYPISYGVWIDYNSNGIFEPTERVFDFIGISVTIATGTFSVPVNVDLVSTTMRVSMSNGNLILDPCELISYGEVEDYTIHLSSLTCSNPTALNVTGVTGSTADIAWTVGSTESSWNISWGAPGYT